MLAPLITFLTSSAGGAFVGFLAEVMASRKEERERKEKLRHDERIAERGHLVEMRKTDILASEIKPTRFDYSRTVTMPMFLLFGPRVTYSHKKVFHKVTDTNRGRTISWIVKLFSFTYCLMLFWYIVNIDTQFETLDPEAPSRSVNFLIFKWTWTPKDTFLLSGGGAVLYLLSPVTFMLTSYVTRRIYARHRP